MIRKNQFRFTSIFILIYFMCFLPVFAQDSGKIIRITRTDNPPKIDGLLEDECWQNVQPVSGFFQHDPKNGEKASEATK